MTPATCRYASSGSDPGPDDAGAQVTRVTDPEGTTQELWMVVPRVTGTTFKGCLIGMLRLQPLLTRIATTVVEDFAIVVFEGEEPIYARHQTTPQYRDTLRQEVAITLPGLTWRVWIWPTVGAILADKLSALPFAVIFMGLVTTVLLASLAYLAQTAQSAPPNWRSPMTPSQKKSASDNAQR